MVRLVFIPSYGTDSSLYTNLRKLDVFDKPQLFTEWLPISECDTLSDYARLFIDHYAITSEDILIGVSLGGVLAIEINRIIAIRKIISISSITITSEKPQIFRFLERTKSYKLFLPQVLKLGLDLIVPLYGRNYSSYLWFRKVFKATSNDFLRWALAEIVCWENDARPDNLVQIHGSRDPLFPIRNASKNNYEIKGGTHAMIRFKSAEIAKIINQEVFSL